VRLRIRSAGVQRVAVVGSGGSGKSTFAQELSRVTGLPLFHLDEYFWRPGWVEAPRDEFRIIQSELVAHDRWIIDGNYSNTYDLRFARVDTVIVLAPPRRVCLYRVVKRVAVNWHRDVQAQGCPERFDISFLHWVWRFPRDARPRLDDALSRYAGRFNLVELSSSAATRRYLSGQRTDSN
jgi:adenylate kinase family enzyme